jgi:hypothetical protein
VIKMKCIMCDSINLYKHGVCKPCYLELILHDEMEEERMLRIEGKTC